MLGTLVMATALAETRSEAVKPAPIAGHAVLEMRVGIDRVEAQHPVICAEASPLAFLSVEGCGTGAGFLHHDGAPDMAHFRARGRIASVGEGRMTAALLGGLGFAEVQRGADAVGFKFGEARAADQLEGAGPEASMGIKGRYWVDPGARTYLSADFTTGAAIIASAPTVIGHGGPVVPFAAFTVGYGF